MTTLLRFEDVAARVPVPPATIRWLIHQNRFPPAAKIGRRLVWREEDITAWIDEQFEQSTGAA